MPLPLITSALALAIGAIMAWGAQGWRLGAQIQASKTAIETLKREHAESLTRATGAAFTTTLKWQKEKDDAIEAARKRAETAAANAAAARRQRDGLRDELASARLRLPSASHEACTEYAAVASGLLDQCAERYQGMAGVASGHAADARTLSEAWPTMPK